MAKPFDAVTVKNALQIGAVVKQLPADVVGLCFVGGWSGRRFVIVNALPVRGDVASVAKDYAAGTVTLSRSFLLSLQDCVRELRSFGAGMTRRSQNGAFDVAVGFDNDTHYVAAAHHVALCGHRGPWSDTSQPHATPVTCHKCAELSKSKPPHRARHHPMNAANRNK